MKKISILLTIILITSNITMAQKTIKLPPVDKAMPVTLMQALDQRHTGRDYKDQEISIEHLSNLLWCANGVNREDGKRTAPSARNCQEIDIYVVLPQGIYLYQPDEHLLQLKAEGDHRAEIGMQDFTHTAPLLLVYVANYDKMADMDENARNLYGATDCGNVSQNVYLYCASAGLETVALGSIYRDKCKKLLHFNGKAILGQAIGFKK